MNTRRLLVVLLVIAVAATSAAVFAQDIFGRRRSSSQTMYGNVEYDAKLTFARIKYDTGFGGFGRRGSRGELPWAHDYPTADIHLMKILNEITIASPRMDGSNVLTLDDPELFNYPIAYMSEPGFWTASDEEVAGLRAYMLKGGFIIFDDFRGGDWNNLEEQMRRVLPEARWVVLDQKHQIFNSFFEIKNFSFGYYGQEIYYGIFEENDPGKRLMAIAGLNQDLGEYWEYSDTGVVPIDLSNEAYKFGVNYFIYGLTH
jgi:Domain of unknown function (DUF4159)